MFFRSRLISLGIAFLCLTPPVHAMIVFTDVASDHPYYEAIQSLSEQGVIQGYENNTFRPDQPVNRVEAVKIVLLGSKVIVPDIQPQEIFPDVMYGVWYDKYVAKAKNLNIVRGDEETGLFRPGDTINLAEVLKMLMTANRMDAQTPDEDPYNDVPKDTWFAPYFGYAKLVGLLDEDADHLVHPDKAVNRGMLAELMYRLSSSPKADEYGKASYYGAQFHGRTTASGDVFDASSFTAAHRTYPFGTWLKVTNVEDGKSTLVRVNDRGPYSEGRIIDLSKAAFEAIAPLSRGVIDVMVEVAPAPPTNSDSSDSAGNIGLFSANLLNVKGADCPEKNNLRYLSRTRFEGIELSTDIPDYLTEEEVFPVSGKVFSTETTVVTAFFSDASGYKTAISATVHDGGFSMNLHFPAPGEYEFGLLPGTSGKSVIEPIHVLPYTCVTEQENEVMTPLSQPLTLIENGEGKILWEKGGYTLFQMTFSQEGVVKRFVLHDVSEWQPSYTDFADFKEGEVEFRLRGGFQQNKSFLENDSAEWSPAISTILNTVTHQEFIAEPDEITLTASPKETQKSGQPLRVQFIPKVSVRSRAAIILPDGQVEMIELKSSDNAVPIKDKNGVDIFPPSESPLLFEYLVRQSGLHFIEINNAGGTASLNIPLYDEDTFPLLPNPGEKTRRESADLGSDITALRLKLAELINRDRRVYKKSSLSLDDSLNQLAQYRSDDMASNHYFSHWNSKGLSANDLRKNFAIGQVVAENLSKDVTLEFAEYGLMRSAIHRANILFPDWTRVGIGISRNTDGTYTFVQLFSENPVDMGNLSQLKERMLAAINRERETPLTEDSNLGGIAQEWSDFMAEKDFFDFTSSDGVTLFDKIKETGINKQIGTYIAGNITFNEVLAQIAKNTALLTSEWNTIGIGIKQDSLGIIKVTLIYSE